MTKTIFEKMGGAHTQAGDYLLHDLKLSGEEQQPIDIWGQQYRRCLKDHRQATHAALALLASGKLNSYLADIDRQAEEISFRLVKRLAAAGGITEKLKANDPMAWVGKMNNIRNRVMEIGLP